MRLGKCHLCVSIDATRLSTIRCSLFAYSGESALFSQPCPSPFSTPRLFKMSDSVGMSRTLRCTCTSYPMPVLCIRMELPSIASAGLTSRTTAAKQRLTHNRPRFRARPSDCAPSPTHWLIAAPSVCSPCPLWPLQAEYGRRCRVHPAPSVIAAIVT